MSSTTAQYVVFTAPYRAELQSESIDPEAIGPHQVFVEAEASVISAGTELANFTALDAGVLQPGSWNAYPWRPGYGMVGRLRAVGSALDLNVGDRVLCMARHASAQVYNLAPDQQPYQGAYPIGDAIPGPTAAMIRMALVAQTAPQITPFRFRDTVVVFGLGVVGNIAAQLFQAGGARVIGVDTLAARCAYAEKVGIETVLNLGPDEQQAAILDLTDGRGADIAVDAVGHSRIIETAVSVCADYGQVVLLGSPRAPHAPADITPIWSRIHLKYLTVRGALEWQNPPFASAGKAPTIADNVRRLAEMVRAGRLNLDALISHTIALADLPETYTRLAAAPHEFMGVVVGYGE